MFNNKRIKELETELEQLKIAFNDLNEFLINVHAKYKVGDLVQFENPK